MSRTARQMRQPSLFRPTFNLPRRDVHTRRRQLVKAWMSRNVVKVRRKWIPAPLLHARFSSSTGSKIPYADFCEIARRHGYTIRNDDGGAYFSNVTFPYWRSEQ